MTKKGLIICAGGMSSSMLAKKVTDYFKEKGEDIEITATTVSEAPKIIEKNNNDLYLISPQARMSFDKLKAASDKVNKPMVNIPPQAYVPIPTGTKKLADLIQENI